MAPARGSARASKTATPTAGRRETSTERDATPRLRRTPVHSSALSQPTAAQRASVKPKRCQVGAASGEAAKARKARAAALASARRVSAKG